MIAGILRPTQGRVLLGGDDVHVNPLAAKMRLGFIPDRPFVYDKLTGAEFLRFVAGLYGQEGDSVERRIAELLEVFELTSWQDELVEAYSHGMRQKLIISSALIHRPECIVVDEPMVGLDPKAARLAEGHLPPVRRAGRHGPDEHAHARDRRSDVRSDRDHPARQDRRRGHGQRRAAPAQGRATRVSEELFLKLTGGAQVRELAEVLGRVKQPSLAHVLQPKWRTALQRMREERAERRHRQADRPGAGRRRVLGRRVRRPVPDSQSLRGVEELGPLIPARCLGLILLSVHIHPGAVERHHGAVELLPGEGPRPARLRAGRLAATLSRETAARRCCTRRGWWR